MTNNRTVIKPASSVKSNSTPLMKPKPRVSGYVPAVPEEPSPQSMENHNNINMPPPLINRQQSATLPPNMVHHSHVPNNQKQTNPSDGHYRQQDIESTSAMMEFVNDGRYVLLSDLPSRYMFYNFTELWIRPFTPNEARLLHMAKVSGNLTYIVSAVAACISKKLSALLIEDFEFCLYWLRLNSYPTKPFSVKWTCDQPLAAESEESEGEDHCSHNQVTIVNSSNLEIISLPEDFVCPSNVALPTMRIFEEIWNIRDRLNNLDEQDPDFEQDREELLGDLYLMDIAQWMAGGTSLNEKVNLLKNSADLSFQSELEISIAKIPNFGVSEELEISCEACGGTNRRKLSLDYLSFFP